MTETHEEPGTAVAVVARDELSNRRLEAGVATGNGVMAPADWQMLAAIAETVKDTEFVPSGLRGSAPRVLACMLYGHALGIPPMIALKEISVIDGTPSMSASLMVAKVREAGHTIKREEIRDEQGDMVGAIAHGTRGDNGETDAFSFTIPMARRAGLMSKKNWQNYPEAMLWHRASSQLCTFLFSDVFMGSPYMPEELGADVPVIEAADDSPFAEEETPEPVMQALTEALTGGAVSPAAVDEAEAAPEEVEPDDEPEAEAQLQGAVETPDGDAVVNVETLWTPLDDRDPLAGEYLFAKALIAGELAHGLDVDGLETALALCQDIVETYEGLQTMQAAHEPAATVATKGTVAELMLTVAELQAAGNLEQLEQLLASEKSMYRPRIRLVAGLEEAIAAVKTPPSDSEPPVETSPQESQGEIEAAFQPGAGTTDDTSPVVETSAPADTARFDPAIPVDELDHQQLVVRVRAVIGYYERTVPDNPDWRYEAIVTSASKIWKLPISSLDELENHNLQKILAAASPVALEAVGKLNGEKVWQLAAGVAGQNPVAS